jgi:hypothetical protein
VQAFAVAAALVVDLLRAAGSGATSNALVTGSEATAATSTRSGAVGGSPIAAVRHHTGWRGIHRRDDHDRHSTQLRSTAHRDERSVGQYQSESLITITAVATP